MRKIFTLTLLFLFSVLTPVEAQNYMPFSSGRTSLFQTGNYFFVMHEDSVEIEGSLLSSYFVKTLDAHGMADGNNCLPYIPMWTGSKFYQSDNDSCSFFNRANDSIIFLPSQPLNATWKLYRYANGNYLEARISQKELLTFTGLTDSVKTVSLQLKNSSGTDIGDPINAFTFKLSKNYGILKATSFLDFPTSYPVYNLVGLDQLNGPVAGMQLLKPREIYNYDIADEFHYEALQSSPPYSNYAYSTKMINRISDKYISANTDTVIYTVHQRKETTTYNYQTQSSSVAYSTNEVKEKIIFNDNVTYYPGQYIENANVYEGYSNLTYYNMITTDDPNGRLGWTSYYSGEVYYNGSCWQTLVSDNLQTTYNFLEGCGLTEMNNDITPGMNHENLVYYKKGSSTNGTPLTLNTSSKKQATFILYPNPLTAGGTLHMQSDNFNGKQVFVYNQLGMQVYTSNDLTENVIILSELKAGLYTIQLINDQNEMLTSKLLIK